MSVILGHTPAGSTEVQYSVAVKGAPETLKSMVPVTLLFLFFNLTFHLNGII